MKTLLFNLVLGLLAASAAFADAPGNVQASATAAGKKSHTLFMGADISIERGKAFYAVRDVSHSSWVINVDGRPESIPTKRNALSLQVKQALKLTEATATLANLKSEQAYTPGADPRAHALVTQMQMSAYMTETAEVAESNLRNTEEAHAFWEGAEQKTGPEPDVGAAIDTLARTQSAATGSLTAPRFHQRIGEEQQKAGNYDAIAIDFDLSAERPLMNPYMIIVVQFHERRAPPGTARNWIYAQSLDPIDATPRKIRLLEGGFPAGYVLEKTDVHVYDRGREVATNLSPRRVELTREEAFQYLVVEHIAAHKGDTVPAEPAMARVPADLKAHIAASEGSRVFYVNVSKEGHVTRAFEDSGFTKPIDDPYLANLVKQIWFKPALDKGEPVAGNAKVDVSRLSL